MRAALLALLAVPALAQPVLQTQWADGVERAVLLHASSGDPVTDAAPAAPGETLIAAGSGMAGDMAVLAGEETVDAACLDDGHVQFTLPGDAGGAFFEISLVSDAGRSNAATVPVAASDPSQLSAADVDGLILRAATAIDDPHMAIAVVDRPGHPLAIYRKPLATDDDVETALSLARTGAFFSHNQAPLSSRTVRTISREHFPNDIPNQPAAPLFGIENTNRGCGFNTVFLAGQSVPPAKNASGTAPGKGITTVPGGIPVFKGGAEVGGLGVAGIDPDAAEFATVAATFGTPFFVPLPLPPPGAVFIDGVRLPYVNQTTRPAGAQAASDPGGVYQIAPRDGAAAPDGYLVGPNAGSALSAAEVDGIIQRSVDRANRTRAIIRLPLGSRAKFAIAVTDLDGTLLGLYRMPDATIFSTDVSVAKARNVVYFSGPSADPSDLPGVPPGTAVTNRTIGFGSQSFFPSGISDSAPGPFRDLYLYDLANPCTQGHQPPNPNQNGVVFFPGSAPLYRNGQLVGGLGVSGDGVDQDDYVTAAGAQGFEPPAAIRADQVFVRGVRLPYFKFPRNPEQ
ncbi:MAG TPA: heme-binding protein [Bryobacterales bacterium]|nr:heme-binding protein [Bryobacterales bacterium]